MSQLSKKKKEKIAEQILSVLYDQFPKPLFTSEIAKEIIRDEEFTKNLLSELSKKDLIVPINKNIEGVNYIRRIKWRLSNKAQNIYSTYSNS